MSENEVSVNDQIQARLDTLKKIQNRGENPYKNGYTPKDLSVPLHELHDGKSKEELEAEGVAVSVAGRIKLIRHFGKAAFVQIHDRCGKVQLFFQKNQLGDADFDRFKELDIGDVIYAEGKLFKTKTNELTANVGQFTLLTKSLKPLPEKYHGIADIELRYRQRYLDLIMNEETRKTFVTRSKVIEAIRQYFVRHDFIEVETPMLHPIQGGATAKPFKTHHNTLDMELFLRIAPELYLKRLVVGGLDRVFEINRNFRNEGISIQHNPEFTMIEWYQAYATFIDLMDCTEELIREVCQTVLGKTQIEYQGTPLDFGGKWKRISIEEAVLEFSDFNDSSKLRDRDALMKYVLSKKWLAPKQAEKMPTGALLTLIFEEEAEAKLIQPTFVTHFPTDVSPLSRRNEKDPFLVDRFELYVFGRELANGFSELNDPIDQKGRFQAQVDAKAAGDEEASDMDHDYVEALEYGLPPTAGEGLGIDRLVMFLTNSPSIRDVILFPQLRKK